MVFSLYILIAKILLMVTKIEGILISKMAYQDRHIIGKILLRNGQVLNCLFYGGKGGGRYKKGTVLELGNMLQIELQVSGRGNNSGLHRAKEWKRMWSHLKIRGEYRAFYLMCLYFELILKLSPEASLNGDYDLHNEEHEGLFRILSNALVYLDNNIPGKDIDTINQFGVFLGKILIVLGIYPRIDNCVLSGISLDQVESMILMPEHGGMADKMSVNDGKNIDCTLLRKFLKMVWVTPYKNIENNLIISKNHVDELFLFFCYQFQFERRFF